MAALPDGIAAVQNAATRARQLAEALDRLAVQLSRFGAEVVTPPAPAPCTTGADDGTLWTVAEVAAFLRTSKSWAYREAERGTLPTIRMGALLRFDPAAVKALASAGGSRGQRALRADVGLRAASADVPLVGGTE